jgi:hypothetical protein
MINYRWWEATNNTLCLGRSGRLTIEQAKRKNTILLVNLHSPERLDQRTMERFTTSNGAADPGFLISISKSYNKTVRPRKWITTSIDHIERNRRWSSLGLWMKMRRGDSAKK